MAAEEAYNYHLWHPRLRDRALVVNVTPGEQNTPPVNSKDFILELLKTFKISAKPAGIAILAYRSSYHSEPSSPEWEDKWPVNWRIELLAVPPIKAKPKLKHEYIGTMAFDPSGMDEEPPAECGCMVVADFEDVAAADACRKKVLESKSISELRHKLLAPEPAFERILLDASLVQEQIYLGQFPAKFFQGGAKYAVAVEKACRLAHGITNFEERSAERDELFDPKGLA